MSDSTPNDAPPASGRARKVFFAAAGLFVLAGALMQLTAPDPQSLPPASAQAPTLETYRISETLSRPQTEIAGLLEARRRVELFSEAEGRVLEVGAAELDYVDEGQQLVRIDPTLAEVASLRARAATLRAESESILASANLERNEGLAGRNVSSRAALDEAENAARLAAASQLEAQAALAEAEDQLAKKTIHAPFAGTLRAFPVEAGEYLHTGERIAELLDVEQLRIKIGLNDREVVDVRPGAEVMVRVDARQADPIVGRVLRVGGAIDLTTRNFPVEIEIDNSEGRLLPGMVARVLLTLGEPRPLLSIPLDAVMEEYGLEHVFVVQRAAGEGEEPRVQKRRIETRMIPFRPTEREVVAGLQPGEMIATTSVRQLRDGMAVRPLPTRGAAEVSRSDAH